MTYKKDDTFIMGKKPYIVLAVKRYPASLKSDRICDNVLIVGMDGQGKHWLADYALKVY